MSVQSMFDDQLLEDFMKTFYGYGNYSSDFWFVGMEEGGGNSFADINNRLHDWDRRGRVELEDIAAYHAEIGGQRFFGPQPKLQPTWNRLIRILLSATGQNVHTEAVRAYQKDHLGRHLSGNCLIELLPLRSPSLGHWLYAQHSRLPYLTSRAEYTSYRAPLRAVHLQQRIQECKPKAVIFYSVNPSYMHWWKVIANAPFTTELADGERMYIAKTADTIFAITRHPVTQGVKNDYFHHVGKIIASHLAEA